MVLSLLLGNVYDGVGDSDGVGDNDDDDNN